MRDLIRSLLVRSASASPLLWRLPSRSILDFPRNDKNVAVKPRSAVSFMTAISALGFSRLRGWEHRATFFFRALRLRRPDHTNRRRTRSRLTFCSTT